MDTKTSLNPCKICGKNVRQGAIFCNGHCKMWIHLKCCNVSYNSVKGLSEKELESWKCNDCALNLNSEQNQDPADPNSDLEDSLTLAAEIGKSLLQENSVLMQQLHDAKFNQSVTVLALEDKLLEKEDVINQLKEDNETKEVDFLLQIKI